MNDTYVTELAPTGEGWQLKVRTPGGLDLEYRYSSEAQARYFAAIIHLGPTKLPPAQKITVAHRRKTRSHKRVHELDDISRDEIEGVLTTLSPDLPLGGIGGEEGGEGRGEGPMDLSPTGT
jgi:hypothetical protein